MIHTVHDAWGKSPYLPRFRFAF
jgi:hypothetical protein